jgi:copper(I)-binding protein
MKYILIALAALGFLATPPAFAQHHAHDAHDASHEASAEAPAGAPSITIGDLEISGAFSRATLPNAPVAAGYLTITNHGASDDRLVSATSPVAGVTQIHEMKMEGDVMKMAELPDGLTIPAGGSVELAPGGLHIMFMRLNDGLVEGTLVPLTLVFERAGDVTVELLVGPVNAGAQAGAHANAPAHGD